MYVGIVMATHDGGITWNQQQISVPDGYIPKTARWSLHHVFFLDQNTGWIVGDYGITFWTENGGQNWNFVGTKKVDFRYVRFLDRNFGWASYSYGYGGSWGIALTTNGGRSWKFLSENFVYGTWPAFGAFLNQQLGFAISLGLYETRDGGNSWKKLKQAVDGLEYLGLGKDGSLVALGLDQGKIVALVSRDRGLTWEVRRGR
jgi:photosystem II stability/assembly factor-like uncharacterized protein